MVESAETTATQEQDGEQQEAVPTMAMIPAAILSTVALFLPNLDKMRLSQGSLFFNQAMQWHFRLLVNQDSATVKELPISMVQQEPVQSA